jgi:hypothetical protein
MLVGEIAWQGSTSEVRGKVDALVRSLDSTFAGGRPYNFVTANCWLDDMRSRQGYQWSRYHYVDVARTEDASGFKIGDPPHVVWAIEDSMKTLQDSSAPESKRIEALGILIHCVGDVHQPLHACTWDDRGGNGYLVAGVTFADLCKGGRGNLHAFWDEGYRVEVSGGKIIESFATPPITARPEPGQASVINEEARRIMKTYPATDLASDITILDPTAWARESYVLGCTLAYPPGPHPGNNEVRPLTPEFATATQAIAAKRVALAGYRLARVLDSLFGKK